MDRYIPESSVLIAIACNVKEAFDEMLEEAARMEEEELFDYLEAMQTEMTNRVKGDLLLALLTENNREALPFEDIEVPTEGSIDG